MHAFLMSLASSTIVGIGLWLFLPRGVTLHRIHPVHDDHGEPMPDTWALQNTTSIAARIIQIKVRSPALDGRSVPLTRDGTHEVRAWFTDHHLDVLREDRKSDTWANIIVPPGETVVFNVNVNRDVDIRYRRANWSGIFERRRISIVGFI